MLVVGAAEAAVPYGRATQGWGVALAVMGAMVIVGLLVPMARRREDGSGVVAMASDGGFAGDNSTLTPEDGDAMAISTETPGHVPETDWPAMQHTLHMMDTIDRMDGLAFEVHVAALLQELGFHTQVTRASGDYGADVVARGDGRILAVQVKRLGPSDRLSLLPIQQVVASLREHGADQGMVVANCSFTEAARHLAERNGVILWDRAALLCELFALALRNEALVQQWATPDWDSIRHGATSGSGRREIRLAGRYRRWHLP